MFKKSTSTKNVNAKKKVKREINKKINKKEKQKAMFKIKDETIKIIKMMTVIKIK